jgi:hypothetical protein
MPRSDWATSLTASAIALALAACSHGGGNNSSSPRTRIDLVANNFSVSPDATDPEDLLTLTGTIQNIGTEAANPNPGDFFLIRFNLSTTGSFQFNEQGFFEQRITDPIPPGGSLSYTYNAPYGGGDTQLKFGNFCTSQACGPPEYGVIGVKVDANDAVRELDEGNNFQFLNHNVVGTRVSASLGTCTFGTLDPNGPGCNLTVTDGLLTTTIHFPCSGGGCTATPILMPNELHPNVSVTLLLKGCTSPPCGWGVTFTGTTEKPGVPPDIVQKQEICDAFMVGDKACPDFIQIRDLNY